MAFLMAVLAILCEGVVMVAILFVIYVEIDTRFRQRQVLRRQSTRQTERTNNPRIL